MISRASRLRDSKEFRTISRSGRKYRSQTVVISVIQSALGHDRFGFVVPKRVGNAVQRNLVKRRLRAICSAIPHQNPPLDIVLRAERPSLGADFDTLRAEVVTGVEKLRSKYKT